MANKRTRRRSENRTSEAASPPQTPAVSAGDSGQGMKIATWVSTVIAIGVFILAITMDQRSRDPEMVAPVSTGLSALASQGEPIFLQRCAMCHGRGAIGSRQGPPLLHEAYGAESFSDASIVRAVRNGVTANRWQFGNMPAIPGISDDDLTALVRYIRELQIQRGI